MLLALAWVVIGLSALLFIAVAAIAFQAWREVDLLVDLPLPELARWPRLSMITPSRDEAAGLEAALRSKLKTDYPALEIVAVDDRSSDGTGAILDALAKEDPRVRAVHITELPAGWLGKVNALAQGAKMATGDWLLFTDADIHFTADALSRAVGYAERRQLDFLALFPELWPSGFWVDVGLTAMMRTLLLGMRKRAIEDPRSSVAVGGGVFNLVRRSALDQTEGFAALKMEVIDDVSLGQMLKRSGARCSVASGQGLVKLHFYRSVGEMMRGGEKNAYAALARFELWRMFLLMPLFFAMEWSPFWAIAAGGLLRQVGLALLVLDLGGAVGLALWMRRSIFSALLTPFGATLVLAIGVRSAYVTTRRGGIAWRDTFYSLAELRKGRVFKVF